MPQLPGAMPSIASFQLTRGPFKIGIIALIRQTRNETPRINIPKIRTIQPAFMTRLLNRSTIVINAPFRRFNLRGKNAVKRNIPKAGGAWSAGRACGPVPYPENNGMGRLMNVRPVLLVAAVFSGRLEGLAWARKNAEKAWGEIALASEPFPFGETDFYAREMGAPLLKQLWGFAKLIDPETLPERKILANAWEEEARSELAPLFGPEIARPVNIDPGYLTEAKLVLASTKDRDP